MHRFRDTDILDLPGLPDWLRKAGDNPWTEVITQSDHSAPYGLECHCSARRNCIDPPSGPLAARTLHEWLGRSVVYLTDRAVVRRRDEYDVELRFGQCDRCGKVFWMQKERP